MKTIHSLLLTLLATAGLSVVGLSAAQAEAPLEFFKPEPFSEKLVLGQDPTEIAGTSRCAIRTAFKWEATSPGVTVARLQEYIEGACDMYVLPQLRTYELTATGTQCGSVHWQGQGKDVEGRVSQIRVVDNRSRVCRDIVDAAVVVSESRPDFGQRIRYALGKGPQACIFGAEAGCRKPIKLGAQ